MPGTVAAGADAFLRGQAAGVPAAHGAFLTVEEGPQRDDLDRFGGFSIVAERGSERWSGRQATLLFDESALVEIGILSPGRVAASGLRQQHYRREYELACPIPSEAIHAKLAPRLRGHFRDALAAEGRVPAGTWAATTAALEELDEDAAKQLRVVLATLAGDGPRLIGDAFQIAAQERDAVRSAMDFAAVSRDALREVAPAGPRSIVERLGYAIAPEDLAITHDSLRFLNAKAIASPAGLVELHDGTTRLVIVNVNRRALESTVGADLIYINETTGSFVLVQYKTMRDVLDEQPVFRPGSDANVARELARMRAVAPGEDDGLPASFRLDPRAGYLKLCLPVVRLKQLDTKPVSGMYLPLALWDALVKTAQARGPRGGLAVGFHNAGRYLTNTQFAELVRGGWIGTRTSSSHELTELVLDALDAGRSVTVAAAAGVDPTRMHR
jgi:hypothetical protein